MIGAKGNPYPKSELEMKYQNADRDKRKWTPEEVSLLIAIYPISSHQSMAETFCRPWPAIREKYRSLSRRKSTSD